jgi:hypothetical protein
LLAGVVPLRPVDLVAVLLSAVQHAQQDRRILLAREPAQGSQVADFNGIRARSGGVLRTKGTGSARIQRATLRPCSPTRKR